MINKEDDINSAELDYQGGPQYDAWQELRGEAEVSDDTDLQHGTWQELSGDSEMSDVSPDDEIEGSKDSAYESDGRGGVMDARVVRRGKGLVNALVGKMDRALGRDNYAHEAITGRGERRKHEMARVALRQLKIEQGADRKDAELYSEYFTDARQENIKFLQEKCPEMLDVYNEIVKQNPKLRIVRLWPFEEEKTNANFSAKEKNPKDGKYYSRVRFKFDDIEAYARDLPESSLVAQAELLGVRVEDLRNNPKLLAEYLLAHEFGHAADHLQDRLAPVYKESRATIGGDRQQFGLAALRAFSTASNMDRATEEHFHRDKSFNRYGDIDEMSFKFGREYREMYMEHYADSFAAGILLSKGMAENRFTAFGEPHELGKAESMIGGTYEVLPKSEPFTGLWSGKGISMAVLEGSDIAKLDASKTKCGSGFLSMPVTVGGPLMVNKHGDYAEVNKNVDPNDPVVEHIYCHPSMSDKGIVRTNYELAMSDGTCVVLRSNGEEPRAIESSMDEMRRRMGFDRRPSVVALCVQDTSLKSDGPLSRKFIEGDITIGGNSLTIKSEKGDLVLSNITRIFRKWRRFYVEVDMGDGNKQVFRISNIKEEK